MPEQMFSLCELAVEQSWWAATSQLHLLWVRAMSFTKYAYQLHKDSPQTHKLDRNHRLDHPPVTLQGQRLASLAADEAQSCLHRLQRSLP